MALVGSAAVLAVSGCSGDTETDGEVELVLETFGTFGYDAVIEEFEEETGYTVDHRVYGEQPDFAEALEQNIAAGSGAGDVVALEEAHIVQMLEQGEAFVDLNDFGAGDMEDQFLDWKWELGQTTDGQLVGLGTDVGSLAICYRWDLFEEAGLPTDREEVGELWPEWEDYLSAGQEFRDADTDAAFVADVGEVYTAITRQAGGEIYFAEADDELIVADNPVVRDAFDFSVELVDEDLSAGLDTFTDDWTAAIQAGTFATMPCPAWMLGQVEDSAGEDGEGLWDVADVPGDGGNWGGSWLAVPEQSENPEAAAELAMFLAGPEGQLNAWEEANNLPSNLEVLESDEVQDTVREYFNDAPTGEIFASVAADLQPYYMGPGHVAVHEDATNPIDEMQRGGISADDAWDQLIEGAERAAR
ncbi:ABC transporter substrate-binding protein [Spiractinospora alimapuensis]|uniref:ABC transporter substrate-binding protein n=1 Tax=Spiractinospora alimapuensis TaxID=2820884 RepID=UPI001F3FE65F|nr:extracellular solute-binding protein [Spiractinospora alimapuensis]